MSISQKLERHQEFLREVHQRRQELEDELASLEFVEQYHQRMVGKLQSDVAQGDAAQGDAAKPEGEEDFGGHAVVVSDQRLSELTKHDACKLALRKLGGTAKTAEVVRWLSDRGYGAKLDAQSRHNSCFTAMKRHPEIFKKVGAGKWRLEEDNQKGTTA